MAGDKCGWGGGPGDTSAPRTEILFWRTHAGREIDFILARGTRLAAIEVKWAEKTADSDIAGIESCRRDLKGRLGPSVALYSGRRAFVLGDRVAAVPLRPFLS